MAETVIILHGWPQEISKHWYSWLKQTLDEKGYATLLPELPTMMSKHPDMPTQVKFVEQLITHNQPVSIIGHSLGAVVALRLAENNKLNKLVLVGGFDYDDLTEGLLSFWPNKLDHSRIIANTQERVVIHSDNDPYTLTEMNAEAMAKRLNATFMLIPNAGHFMETDGWTTLPQVNNLFAAL